MLPVFTAGLVVTVVWKASYEPLQLDDLAEE